MRIAALPPAAAARAQLAWREGRYGLCATCGDPIDGDALRARPDLASCAACAAELRARQAGRRFGVCGIKGG